MCKVYFICGFVGSGKTTFSKKLSQEKSAFRFSIDEWMIPLFGEHMERELFDERMATLTRLFKESAINMTQLGLPVIFDFGFWTKKERDDIKQWAEDHHIEYEMYFLNTNYQDCYQRAIARNSIQDNHSFHMTDDMLRLFWSWFEQPDSSEHMIHI